MLGMTLATLSGCTTPAPEISPSGWCLSDRWMCWSHSDTAATISQIDQHNARFGAACPLQPQRCKP